MNIRHDLPHSTFAASCAICGQSSNDILYQNTVGSTGAVITIVQCDGCGNAYNSPRPSPENYATFYGEGLETSAVVFRESGEGTHYDLRNQERLDFFLTSEDLSRAGIHVDIGSGTGQWLKLMKRARPNLRHLGVEPSHAAVAELSGHGFEMILGGWEELEKIEQLVSVVSLISVLEHLVDPRGALELVREKLDPQGMLLLEVPNTLNPVFSCGGYFSPEHIIHFSPHTLAKLLGVAGFYVDSIDQNCSDAVRVVAKPLQKGHKGVEIFSDTDRLSYAIREFQVSEKARTESIVDQVREFMSDTREEGGQLCVYGAGVHTVELIAQLSPEDLVYIDFFVDGDPVKQSKPFYGRQVVSPELLPSLAPAGIIISSQRFRLEIHGLLDRMFGGQKPRVLDFG